MFMRYPCKVSLDDAASRGACQPVFAERPHRRLMNTVADSGLPGRRSGVALGSHDAKKEERKEANAGVLELVPEGRRGALFHE